MYTLSILLKASWQGWTNSIRHASETRRKKVAEILGFCVLIAALYLMGRAVFREASIQLGDAYEKTILQAINIFMGLGVFVLAKDAMEGTIKQLYEAPDTLLLLSSPLSPSTVFAFKLIQLTASNLFSMAIWLFPPWIAFGQLFHLPWPFYATLIPICFCLHLIIVGEVVIVLMLIVRFFSSRRMVRFLKICGTAVGVGAGFLLSISLLTIEDSDRLAQFLLARLKIPASDWYPHLWAAKLMMSWLPESQIQPLRWATQLLVVSAGVPVLGVLLAGKIYARSWEYGRSVESSMKSRGKRQAKFPIWGRGTIRSMMAKDFLVFIRHKGRVAMIVMLSLILLIVMFGATYKMRTDSQSDFSIHVSLFGLGVQIMIYSVMITFGLTWGGFKAEAKTWWLLKSGPISPKLLFNSKFLTATLCAVAYTNLWMFLALILFRVSTWAWLPILLTTTLVTAATVAFNTAIGTLPWMAEIGATDRGSDKRPALRFMTILLGMAANMILLIGPALLLEIIVFSNGQLFGDERRAAIQRMSVFGTAIVLISVWGVSYLLGMRSLRKLLL